MKLGLIYITLDASYCEKFEKKKFEIHLKTVIYLFVCLFYFYYPQGTYDFFIPQTVNERI